MGDKHFSPGGGRYYPITLWNKHCLWLSGSIFHITIFYTKIRIIVWLINNYRCGPCDSKCESCTGPNADQCITCKSGYFELKGTCHSKCPDFYYPDQKRHECLACPAGCVACNSTACHACDQNFSLNKKGRCLKTGSQQCQPGKNTFILTIFTIICLHVQKCYDFYFLLFKLVNFGLVRSVNRVTIPVKLVAIFLMKTVCHVDHRPCIKHLVCAWNSVLRAFIQTCGSATTRLANRARIHVSNVCPARIVQCAIHHCSCKPASVVRHVPQGMSQNVFLSGFNQSK